MATAKINIADNHKATLRTEFKTSQQTVRLALDDYTKSDLSSRIRKRAIELMEEDLKAAKEIEE